MSDVLVHIGYEKTGTTWLQRNVFGEPKAGFFLIGDGRKTPIRQLVTAAPFSFDADLIRRSVEPQLRRAEQAGQLPVVSAERLSGTAPSGGYDTRQIADRVKQVFPTARILVVAREQRSMIVAAYKQYVKAGGPCSPERFLDPPANKSVKVPSFDLSYFAYEPLIAYYRSLYDGDHVRTLVFEQFLDDPGAFVAMIGAFANQPISREVLDRLPHESTANRSPSALTISTMRFLNRVAPRRELNPAPVFELATVSRLLHRLKTNDAMTRVAPRGLVARKEAKLRQIVAEVVGDRYVAGNRRLAELAGVDLGAYGWMV